MQATIQKFEIIFVDKEMVDECAIKIWHKFWIWSGSGTNMSHVAFGIVTDKRREIIENLFIFECLVCYFSITFAQVLTTPENYLYWAVLLLCPSWHTRKIQKKNARSQFGIFLDKSAQVHNKIFNRLKIGFFLHTLHPTILCFFFNIQIDIFDDNGPEFVLKT